MIATHGLSLGRRIIAAHRRVVLPLLTVFTINLFVYVLIVYPLGQRVANVEQRNQAAEQALSAARVEHAQANGALTGKDRASAELAKFYGEVLPQDLSDARRMTQLRLRQLARESNLEFERDVYEPVQDRDSTLTRLRISMALSGTYDDMRAFIHELEIAPEFVVIENVELSSGADDGAVLGVTVDLSTYYRATP